MENKQSKEVKIMTHNEFDKYLEEIANRVYTDPNYNILDYKRDADSVIVKGFELEKSFLSEDHKTIVNEFFDTNDLTNNGNMFLRGHLNCYDMIYGFAKMLSCETICDNGLTSYFRNDKEKIILTFSEGDIALTVCNSEEEFQKEVTAADIFYGIKASFSKKLEEAKIKHQQSLNKNNHEPSKKFPEKDR